MTMQRNSAGTTQLSHVFVLEFLQGQSTLIHIAVNLIESVALKKCMILNQSAKQVL